MLKNHISMPFEIHITVDCLSSSEHFMFIQFCLERALKPVFIELARGFHVQQPMLSKVVFASSLQTALAAANKLVLELKELLFKPLRLKIEVPCEYWGASPFSGMTTTYFEWHGKIDFIDVLRLNPTM
jgi:hypothetical protein